MKIKKNGKKNTGKTSVPSSTKTEKKDNDADKSGTDTNADKTTVENPDKIKREEKFDKPAREPNPDSTEIPTGKNKNSQVKKRK